VNLLFAASDGTLWIATETQLASWKNGELTIIPAINEGLNGGIGWINKFVEDRKHRVWFAISRRRDGKPLCQIVGAGVRCYGASDGINLPYGLGLGLEADDSLAIASSDTIVEWSLEHGQISTAKASSVSQFAPLRGITDLEAQKDGSMLIGVQYAGKGLGILRQESTSLVPFEVPGFDSTALEVETLHTDHPGALWIGTTRSGLYRIFEGNVDHYSTQDGLSGNWIRDFHEDAEDNMWVVTDGGIDCFHDLKVVPWGTAEGLPSGNVFSVSAGHDGSVLVGIGDTLSMIRDGKATSVSHAPGMPLGHVDAVWNDRSGRHWASIGNDLGTYDGHRFSLVKRRDGEPFGPVTSFAESPDGSIWAVTLPRPRALIHLQHGKPTETATTDTAVSISADRAGGVWIHSSKFGRIGHYINGQFQWTSLTPPDDPRGFGGQDDIATADDGSVFLASKTGVWVFKDGRVRTLGIGNGLPCQDVNGLVFSNRGSLWMRASCGLIEVPSDGLKAWWSNPGGRVTYRRIDPSDGAQTSRAVFFPEMSLAPDGKIWIANEAGVEAIDPDHIPINLLPPPVHIQEVVADRATLNAVAGLKIAPLTRNLEIHYTALSFSSPQKVQFKYKLDDYDTKWLEPGTRRTAYYQDLKPGHYTFHVIAANNDGVWNDTGDSLEFEVKPAWFQTLWFLVLWISSASLFLFVIYRVRVNSIARAMSTRFNERLDERTRMARELHDTFLQTVQGSKMVADNALACGTDENRMRNALEKLSIWLGQAVTEGRAALHVLRESTTEQNQLAEFLDRTLNEQCHEVSLPYTLTVVGDARGLHPIVRDEISLIAKEAIRNACSHSKASQLRLELRYANDLSLCFTDDGIGIDPHILQAGRAGHFGLHTMRERSERIGAKLTTSSPDNGGTAVILRVPGEIAYERGHRSLADRIRALFHLVDLRDGRDDLHN
jgi:signal transduction histidine kinase